MSQTSLFGDHSTSFDSFEAFSLPQAELRYYAHYFSQIEADELFATLRHEIDWQQHCIRIAGVERLQPRLSAWYGDPDAHYSYSHLRLQPSPWTQTLLELKQRLEASCNTSFNSVLLNLYRDQQDSMGWHADDEKELGSRPVIASLSFGASRDFLIKHKVDPQLKRKVALEHGSLLVMGGDMQSHWLHAIAKQKEQLGPRLNLTFRQIHPAI